MPFEPRNDFDFLPPIEESGLSAAANWAASRDDSMRNSLAEARQNERALADLIRQFDRKRLVDANGTEWEFLGRRIGNQDEDGTLLGFTVIDGGTPSAPTFSVQPSVITGLNASYVTPTLGGSELYTDPAPSASSTANHWVFLRIEIEPVALGDEAPYGIADDDFTLVSRTIVTAADDAEAQAAEIDPDTGEATNGVYLFPLAKFNAEARKAFQVIYGPVAASWCQGLVKVAPPVVIHRGTVESV